MSFIALFYLWNLGFALESATPPDTLPKKSFEETAYHNIKKGDIVWVKSGFLRHFYEHVFPKISEPFILMVNDGDESFPEQQASFFDVEKLITSEKVLHIFAQNCSLTTSHPKISPLPIGVDFHTLAKRPKIWKEGKASPEKQERELQKLLSKLKPTGTRKPRIFVDFHHTDSLRKGPFKRYLALGEDRESIFKELEKTGLIDYSQNRIQRSKLWKTKGGYAFSVSPQGNGMDCHRTWEDLILGCIVIVKTSPLDPLYKGLPVVIVKEWAEITEGNLQKWLDQYSDAFTNPSYREKLTHGYWMDQIKIKQAELSGSAL